VHRNRLRRSVWLAAALAGLLASPAFAQTDTSVTFTYPPLPGPSQLDDDGYLVPTAHTFQEGGMHVEASGSNTIPEFSPLDHLHIYFRTPNRAESRRRLVGGLRAGSAGSVRAPRGRRAFRPPEPRPPRQPTATSLLIGTDYDPALPITAQLTAYPVSADENFQTLAPAGFEGVTQLFIAWSLGEATSDRGEIDDLRFTIPHGSCSGSAPSGLVFSHTGQADPTTEGWTALGGGTSVATFPVSDGGVDAWVVDDDGSGAGSSRFYSRNLPPDVMCWARTAGARLRTHMRIVDVPDTLDNARATCAMIR
jgi:hypothetical protein